MRENILPGLGLLLIGATAWAQQYLITTVAGGGLPASGIPAVSAGFPEPYGIAADERGNVYFSTGDCVYKVDGAGILTRVAGSAGAGYLGDGGPATGAQLNTPEGVAVDGAENLYIADSGNNVIRKVAPDGSITTVAGNGTGGYSGDGGFATGAKLNAPSGVAVDGAGNLYIADVSNGRIRRVAANGIISTMAISAQLNRASGVAVDSAGNLYIADTLNQKIRKVAGDGTTTTVADTGACGSGYGCGRPYGVAVDAAGNLYIAGSGMNGIRKMAADGTITMVAGNGIAGYSGDGGPATEAQLSVVVSGVALDAAGNLYIADSRNSRIRKVARNGIITTMAGNGTGDEGGRATSVQLDSPSGVALDAGGSLYIADTGNNRILKVAGDGTTATVATDGSFGPLPAGLERPNAIAVDAAGNLYIAHGVDFIREVAAGGQVSQSYLGDHTSVRGLATGAAGGLYSSEVRGYQGYDFQGHMIWYDEGSVVLSNGGILAGGATSGYSGDGGPATSALLNVPGGLAVDGAGNLYIADSENYRIRKVAADSTITTVAGNGTSGYSGDGGPATSAQLGQLDGLAMDTAGNLYVGDISRIRKVATDGTITTVAGNGAQGYSGDGGPATSARLGLVHGLAVDAAGTVYFADSNNVIRALVPQTSARLSVMIARSGNFAQGQTGATYLVSVSNSAGAGPTSGTVRVTEIVPAGLTLVSMSGEGWNCSGSACSRVDSVGSGSSYPPITVTVNVAVDAPFLVWNQVTVSGGGSIWASASDVAQVPGLPAPVPVSPANGSAGAVVAPTLTWKASGGAESYDVYIGTSSVPPLAASTTGTSCAAGMLISDTTYYWQIVARNETGVAESETWSFTTGAPAVGMRFVPVTPCRVADTRFGSGPFGQPSLAPDTERSFPIPQSTCGIPATAQAYSLNVTVVPKGYLGYLTLWPTGQPRPGVSTLNSWQGIVVANAAIVPAGADGAVSFYVPQAADVILDINGYFDSSTGPDSYAFYPATPCRVADTRWSAGQFSGPAMFGGQTRDFPIPLGSCDVPATARAYAMNLTVVPAGYLGYLTTWATGVERPNVSTLNSWTGKVVANAAIVPGGTNESISVFVTQQTNVILDINGYFGAPAGEGALSFYPVTPCRIADTRGAAGPILGAETTRSFAIPASGCNIPSTAAAYSLNVTAVPQGYLGYLVAWPAGSPQPNVSTLNSWDGAVVANAAIVPAGTDGAIRIYVTNPTHVILDINGYFAP